MMYKKYDFNAELQRNKARNKKRGYGTSIIVPYEIENKVATGKWFVTCRKKSHLLAI